MISDVIEKNQQYVVLDEYNKKISSNYFSSLGELIGFTGSFLVFRKNQQYIVYDEDLTKIASNYG